MKNTAQGMSFKPVLIGGVIFIWLGLIFLLYSDLHGGLGFGLFFLIVILISWALSMAVVYLQNRAIPDAVILEDEGFRIGYKSGKEKQIKWNEIEFIDSVPNESSPTDKGKRRDQYCLKGGNPVFVDSEIAHRLVDGYGEFMGKRPPTTVRNKKD